MKVVPITLEVEPSAWQGIALFVPRSPADTLLHPAIHASPILATHRQADRSSIQEAVVDLLAEAQHRVFCCSFLIGGTTATGAISECAKRLRGHTYVITALDERMLGRNLEREGDLDPNLVHREIKRFQLLTRAGAYVRGAPGCHAKFLVVDDVAALVTSANFDQNGLGEDASQAAGEVGLVLRGAKRVEPLAQFFRHLWRDTCRYEALPHPERYAVLTRRGEGGEPPVLAEDPEAVLWTADGQHQILGFVRESIRSAQNRLLLGSYSFTKMADEPGLVIDDLLDAVRRGVRVELFVRSRSIDLQDLAPLVAGGVQVRADRANHAKYVVADTRMGAIFSANLDGQYGLTAGREVGVRLASVELGALIGYHESCWSAAPLQVALSENLAAVRGLIPGLGTIDTPDVLVHEQHADEARAILRGPWVIAEASGFRWLVGEGSVVPLADSVDFQTVDAGPGPAGLGPVLAQADTSYVVFLPKVMT